MTVAELIENMTKLDQTAIVMCDNGFRIRHVEKEDLVMTSDTDGTAYCYIEIA